MKEEMKEDSFQRIALDLFKFIYENDTSVKLSPEKGLAAYRKCFEAVSKTLD